MSAKKKPAEPAKIGELGAEKLRSSGLSTEDAKELGIVEVRADEVDPDFQALRALRIAYRDLEGADSGFCRVRYLEKPSGFAGTVEKPQRYVQSAGTLNWVYLPWIDGIDWKVIANDATIPILITEGELKAACATKMGWPTLGLGGVTVWQSAKKKVPLLPPLDQFNWKARAVTVVFDSDASTNPDVARAQLRLSDELSRLGAVPKIAALPGSGDRKTGLDDFLVAGGDLAMVLQQSRATDVVRELSALNEQYLYIADQDTVLSLGRDTRYKRDSFINGLLANNRLVEFVSGSRGNRRVELSAGQEWLRWPTRRTVNALAYEPGQPRFTKDGDYNLWKGWGIVPAAGNLEPWYKLLDFLLEGLSPAHRLWFERWCACPLQHPGVKMYSAVVLWGPMKGTGKSLIGYTLGKIYGSNFTEIGNTELHAPFNEWAVGKQFVMGEEITGSDRRHEADKLKSLITQQRLRINMKHLPTYEVRDCLNYYFNSNHPDAFFIDDQERRYFVHRVLGRPLPFAFYKDFIRWRDHEGGAEALFRYLLDLDLGDFDPAAPAPTTDSKAEMVDHSKSDLGAFVANLQANMTDELSRLQRLYHLPESPDLALNQHLRMLYDPEGSAKVTANGLGRELSRAGFKTLPPLQTATFGRQRFYVLRNEEKWLDLQPKEAKDYIDHVWKGVKAS